MAESGPTTSTPTPAAKPEAAPAAAPAWGDESFRILLFGMPGVGKSSLLGALAEAAQHPKLVHTLNSRLVDRSGGGLAELQRRLYEGPQIATAQEVVRYQIEFEPFAQDRVGGRDKYHATLIDCDGRIVHDLLARRKALADNSPEGSLAKEVINADTLVLVVDAYAPPVQNDADFNEFSSFLRLLERCRGQRSDIGGLPVYLVLTKCDKLAGPDDTPSDWLEGIEKRKRDVNHRFRDFIARREAEEGPLPFGRVAFNNVWATAVKRPALKGQPARPREPYGVAELFRMCLASAKEYSQRRRKSRSQLLWTVGIAGSVVALLGALAVALIFGPQDPKPAALESTVVEYRSKEGPFPAVWLREPLQPKISVLSEIKSHRDFENLPDDLRGYVTERLQELKDYKDYKDQVERVFQPLAKKTTEDELRDVERAADRIKPPEEYQNEWDQTEASLLLRERKADIKALRVAVQDARDWFQDLKKKSAELLSFSTEGPLAPRRVPETWSAWHGRLRELLNQADRPPFDEKEPLTGSKFLAWRTALAFSEVAEARSEWNVIRLRLERVRDMSAALGLAGTVADRPAVLKIPPPPNFTLDDTYGRAQEMERAYPGWRDFSQDDLPENVPGLFAPVARGYYENLLEPARKVVLKRLQDVSPDGKESLARWRSLRPWLERPDELSAWRNLARALGRIANANWSDPVNDLAAFVMENRFRIEIQRMKFEVPRALGIKPAGRLEVFHPRTNANGPAMIFEVADSLDRPSVDNVRGVKAWTLRLISDERTLAYDPGDDLWVKLPVTDDQGEWMLTWARSRSLVWQFERLVNVPQKHRRNTENSEKDDRPEVYLRSFTPERNVPIVPDLVPVVRLDRR
jgi:GTPase SAR1 family protein